MWPQHGAIGHDRSQNDATAELLGEPPSSVRAITVLHQAERTVCLPIERLVGKDIPVWFLQGQKPSQVTPPLPCCSMLVHPREQSRERSKELNQVIFSL